MGIKRVKNSIIFFILLTVSIFVIVNCDEEPSSEADIPNPVRAEYHKWEVIEPGDDYVCALNTPYKFFVNYDNYSNNLVIYFEPGGACWQYDMCSPEGTSHLGASHITGVTDDLIDIWGTLATPFFQRTNPENPFTDWNYIFVPYCTGDVHMGNTVRTYTDESGENSVTIHHNGYNNVQSVINFINENFNNIGKLMLTGSSAGGFGSNINYFRFRDEITIADEYFLINDSGPILPNKTDYLDEFYDKVISSWDVIPLLPEGIPDDFGEYNLWLADRYPNDKLSSIVFKRDYNVSRFYFDYYLEDPTKDNVHAAFWEGLQDMIDIFNQADNLNYYIPYYRTVNSSHCLSIIAFADTDIPEYDITLPQWIEQMIYYDADWTSLLESDQAGEDE